MRITRTVVATLCLLVALSACAPSRREPCSTCVSPHAVEKFVAGEAASRWIRGALVQWSRDWNARDLDAVCGLFAPDVVLLYPDAPNRDHAAMCKGFAETFARTDRTIRYDPPAIQEILVDGELAVVRLVWTARIRNSGADAGAKSAASERIERENGIDVFQRQPDGRWRIRISHAYPEE